MSSSDLTLVAPLKKLAKASEAKLGGVACFIVKDGTIISSGLNHNPTGAPMEMIVDDKLVSRPEVVHAEIAALEAAAKNEVNIDGATMMLTMSPCIKCARAIAQSEIASVHYLYEWWDAAGLAILREHNIDVKKIEEVKK